MGSPEISNNSGNTLRFEEIKSRGVMSLTAALDPTVTQRIKQFQMKHNM